MKRPARRGALIGLAFAAACGGGGDEQGVSRAAFVGAYIDLRGATVAGELDARTRDSILSAHGTTEEELRAYVTQRAEDPDAIADTWREIMDSIAAREIAAVASDTTDTTAVEPDSTAAEPDTSSAS